MRKQPLTVIHPADFPTWLAAKVGTTPVAEFAESLGVSRQYLWTLIAGKVRPSDKMLEKLGLETWYGTKD